jgi:hypothetical protein
MSELNMWRGLACIAVMEFPVFMHITDLFLIGFVVFLLFLFLISCVR